MSVGGIVGGAIGFFIGGPAGALQGYELGSMAQSVLDPPKGPTNYQQGPRLNDLTQQTSSYGVGIAEVDGTIALNGNIFWIENNKVKEVATTTSSGGGGKGGGGGGTNIQTTYAYYGTFAVGLCVGPVAGVRRIWISGKLYYDAGSADIGEIQASNAAAGFFKVYTGSDTQLPDPRMQAALGVANTPAYRGLAYIVFYNLSLKDFSNTIAGAQVQVEVIKAGTNTPALLKRGSLVTGKFGTVVAVSGNYAYVAGDTFTMNVFDIANPNVSLMVGSINAGYPAIFYATGIAISGNHLYITSHITDKLVIFDISNPTVPVFSGKVTTGTNPNAVFINGNHAVVVNQNSTFQIIDVTDPSLPQVISTTLVETNSQPSAVQVSGSYAYVASGNSPSNTGLHVYDISNPYLPVLVSSLNAYPSQDISVSGNYAYMISGTGLQVIDISNPAAPVIVGFTSSEGMSPYKIKVSGNYAYMLNSYGLQKFQVYDISAHGNPVKVASYSGINDPRWLYLSGSDMFVVTATGHSLESFIFAPIVIASTVPTLASIVQEKMLKSNLLTAGDLDVSLLTASVRGYGVKSVGTIRSSIEPLQGAFPFDVVQAGYQIKCIPRGQASVATIDVSELDARAGGNAPGVQLTRMREMDSMLPVKVSLKYLDVDREYNIGEQYAERLNTTAVNIQALNLAIVLNALEAAQKAEVLLYMYWLERFLVNFSLPPTYNRLEPADVITINNAGTMHELRLININYTSGGWLECAAKYNKASLYTPAALGASGASTGSTLSAEGASHYELLDIPLLLDALDMPGFPVAMCGYLSGWPGGVLERSDDAGQTWTAVQGFSRPGTAMGYAGAALAAHDGHLIDKAGVLAVTLVSGALYSTTEALMLAGSNYFAYGIDGRWEIIAAQNCVLQADGSYLLTDLLRGRQGTEWASGMHAQGDKLVALSSASMAFITANLNQIGLSRDYRGITAGQSLDTDASLSWAYQGVNLECLSPVQLNGNRHPTSNDWTLSWTRRTRIGGEWRDYVDALLGEPSENYVVEVWDASYTTLKRTLAATTPTVAYTSAQQVADFGSNQATLYLKIAQVSAHVGTGYYLKQSITR